MFNGERERERESMVFILQFPFGAFFFLTSSFEQHETLALDAGTLFESLLRSGTKVETGLRHAPKP